MSSAAILFGALRVKTQLWKGCIVQESKNRKLQNMFPIVKIVEKYGGVKPHVRC